MLYISGHNAFPNSYRNNPPLDDFEEDDDEWDESDEEVAFILHSSI